MVDSNRMNRLAAKILQEVGYKEPVPPVYVEMGTFQLDYQLDPNEPTGGRYQACYQQAWDGDPYEAWDAELLDMHFVYGETVMEVIGELMTVLGRPIKSDEWELGYDERDEEE